MAPMWCFSMSILICGVTFGPSKPIMNSWPCSRRQSPRTPSPCAMQSAMACVPASCELVSHRPRSTLHQTHLSRSSHTGSSEGTSLLTTMIACAAGARLARRRAAAAGRCFNQRGPRDAAGLASGRSAGGKSMLQSHVGFTPGIRSTFTVTVWVVSRALLGGPGVGVCCNLVSRPSAWHRNRLAGRGHTAEFLADVVRSLVQREHSPRAAMCAAIPPSLAVNFGTEKSTKLCALAQGHSRHSAHADIGSREPRSR